METKIFKVLDEKFLGKLKNREVLNEKKYLIGISAVPKAGISTLAKMIEERYKGMRIEKNAARNIIYNNLNITDVREVEALLDDYLEKRVEMIFSLPNKLIIWDGSIDRNYKKYQSWAEKYGFRTFVIHLNTDRDILEERIKRDEDEKTAYWYQMALDNWIRDNNEYTKTQPVDFTINNNSKEETNNLFITLDQLLKDK